MSPLDLKQGEIMNILTPLEIWLTMLFYYTRDVEECRYAMDVLYNVEKAAATIEESDDIKACMDFLFVKGNIKVLEEKKMHLRLDLYSTTKHAQDRMKELGITYQEATPQSIADQWWFWNCENVPNPLPDGLTELGLDPILDGIGNGLSKEDAEAIKEAE
jgi:hypothetical protein